ncbi:MAG: hypothetical protein BWY60_00233 [Actinobacteria bacterium ADurb.Bin346]|nr:MAG: hypothetical protein BWY60_00233 [Actinobacteria bacterium ADurb.Bin346]
MRKTLLMKNLYIKNILFFAVIFIITMFVLPANISAAPVDIVKWNFLDQNQIADGGITENLSKTINLSYTPSGGITYSEGSGGSGTFAISANNWNSGSGTKYWEVEFSTQGYNNLTLAFSQRSSGTGPRDFKVQYKIGSGGTWSDVPGASMALGNGIWFNSTNYNLPADSYNRSSVYLRWIMTSNTSANGGTVATAGTNRITNIVVKGELITPKGVITVNKSVGSGVSPGQVFSFEINTSPAQSVQITGVGTASFTGLAAGTYTITETTSGFNTQVSADNSTWTPQNSIDVTITGSVGSEDSKSVYFKNDKDSGASSSKIVEWNFLDENQTADGGVPENLSKTITLSFSPAIFTYYNGPGGSGTRAIAADSWNNGADSKYWEVEFSTKDHSDLMFSFSQRSSDTGPRDFNLQYKIGAGGTWSTFRSYSLPGTDFLNVFNLALPSDTYNQESVYLRWLMASETAADGRNVGPLGTNRITNIIVSVNEIEEGGEVTPGPGSVEIEEPVWIRNVPMTCWQVWINRDNKFEFIFWWEYKDNNWVKIYDLSGKEVFKIDMPYGNARFEASLPDGIYNVKTFHDDPNVSLQEFLISKP